MIHSITVINHLGESIKLELTRPDRSGFVVKSVEGLGPVKATINKTQLAMSDGSLYNSSYLGERDITLTLEFYDSAKESIEDIRQKSYKYFQRKQPITLRIETDNRTVEARGYVDSNEPNIFSNAEGCTIIVNCPDPYLYTSQTNVTTFSGIEPAFEFPLENNSLDEPLLELSLIRHTTETSAFYEGDLDAGTSIIIRAIGEASNVTIYNINTREKFSIDTNKMATMTGSGIIAGDMIIIKTAKHDKSLTLTRDGVTTNILNCMVKGSKWFTLTKGDNIFAYTAETGETNLQFTIETKVVYDGV